MKVKEVIKKRNLEKVTIEIETSTFYTILYCDCDISSVDQKDLDKEVKSVYTDRFGRFTMQVWC